MSHPLVVVLEDDVTNAWGLSLVLSDWGYRTVIGDSLEPVMDELEQVGKPPDALICDYNLANGETGVEAAASILSRYGKTIPVVVVSGSSGRTAIRSAGAHDFPVLSKPVDPDELQTYLPAP